VVTALRLTGSPLVVAVIALVSARTAMLPGLAFWDTAELEAVGPLMGHGPSGWLPDLGARAPRRSSLSPASSIGGPSGPLVNGRHDLAGDGP
jgi:hypothetical protein